VGKQILIVFFFVFCFSVFVCSVFAQSIASAELIANTRQYDGKTVSFQGEVIGDIMPREKFVWMNVSDGQNAIGVWAIADLIQGILYSASYTTIGDQVKIRGTFNRRCSQHGGDLDIHALSVEKINSGMGIHETINKVKLFLVILLGGLCLILILIRFRKS